MQKQDFNLTVNVKASPAETLEKINQVNQWWAKKVKGHADKKGDAFTVDFGKTFVDFQISELIPEKKVVWKVTDSNLHWISNKKEWNGTEVVFELSKKNNATQINFTHIGLVPKSECYGNCEAGWTEHITVSLVKLINEGKGNPE